MQTSRAKTLFIILTVLFISLACQLNVGGPRPPKTAVPISTEAAQSLEQVWQDAVQQDEANGGELVAFTLTEEQITSYLAQKMASDPEPLLTEPQVLLRDGQAEIYGTVQKGMIAANIRIVLKVNVDPTNGNLSADIISADFGPLPVPKDLRQEITSILNETLTGSLAPVTTGLIVQSVFIDNGMITISAIKQ